MIVNGKTNLQIVGQGKPIVYLHGWGCSGDIFLPVTQYLPQYSNFLLDFYGFGGSCPPPISGYTVFDFVNQVAELLDFYGLKKVPIVAHSFGCRVAMILAANYPELLSGMLLFAPAGLRRFSLKRWVKESNYKLKKKFKLKQNASGSEDYLACSYTMKNTFVKVVNQDLSLFAKRVNLPTLIVNGADDKSVPPKDAKRLHKLIKHSEIYEIAGDHFALFYTPKAFAEIIALFAE